MESIDRMEQLFTTPCYIIDLLPKQAPKGAQGRFFEVEQYLLLPPALCDTAARFTRLLLKLQCYYRLETYRGEERLDDGEIGAFVKLIEKTALEKSGWLNLLLPNADAMICVEGGALHLTVYNPSPELQELLSQLARSEGLFWREGTG